MSDFKNLPPGEYLVRFEYWGGMSLGPKTDYCLWQGTLIIHDDDMYQMHGNGD